MSRILTAGDARAILARVKASGLSGMGKVNRGLTKQQTWDIMIAGIEHLTDGEAVHSLAAKNIRREFGQ